MEGERSNSGRSGRSAVAVAGRREEKGEAEKLHMLLPPTCMDRKRTDEYPPPRLGRFAKLYGSGHWIHVRVEN